MNNYYKPGDWNAILHKICSRCNKTLDISSFYKQKDGKFGVTSRCKSCVQESNKIWADNNKDKRNKHQRIRLENPHNKQKALEASKKWRKNNLEYDAARQRKRKAYKILAIPSWFESEEDKIQFVYKKAKELNLTVDHIVPLKHDLVCGLHTWANLQLLENSLNCAKRNLWWPDA